MTTEPKQVKVEITAERTKGVRGTTTKIVVVDEASTENNTINAAKLKWLNDYISRDHGNVNYLDLTKASKYAGVKVKGKIVA